MRMIKEREKEREREIKKKKKKREETKEPFFSADRGRPNVEEEKD